MPIPDQPKNPDEITIEMRRDRTMDEIVRNMSQAIIRTTVFMRQNSTDQAIKSLHFADTDVVNDDQTTTRMRYYSLWDSKSLRLLTTGRLARPLDMPNQDVEVDRSQIVPINDSEKGLGGYNLAQLADIALHLDKVLKNEESPPKDGTDESAGLSDEL